MDWKFSLLYLVPATIILLLVFPIVIEFRAGFNPLYNRGVVAMFIFKKKIFSFIFSLSGKMIELQNEGAGGAKQIEFDSKEFALMKNFAGEIKDKIRLKNCFVFYNIGTGDAYSSALVCGVLNQIFTQIFVYIKSIKPTASLCVYDNVSYNRVVCEVALRTKISLSFFEVVYSYLHSLIITKRRK